MSPIGDRVGGTDARGVAVTPMLGLLALGVLALPLPRAAGVTVESTSANTQVVLDTPYNEAEDPTVGQVVAGCLVLEWRDADYQPGTALPYKDWTAVGGPDGHPNEIWLRNSTMSASTSTTVNSAIVAIHLVGDNNDGRTEVYVDGTLVATLDMYTPSPPSQTAIVVVSGLADATHSIDVKDIGISTHGGSGDDVAILGASACAPAPDLYPKWRQFPHGEDEGFDVPSWLDWLLFIQGGPNEVVADDFISDGRPITHIRWWGSYVDPVFEPICAPMPGGFGCKPVTCPNPFEACVPVRARFSTITGQSIVLECECRDPGGCQVLLLPGEEPYCIGTCPEGFVCQQEVINNGDGTFDYMCNCIPQPPGATAPGPSFAFVGPPAPVGPGDGACCLDGVCIGEMPEPDCLNLGGQWFAGALCDGFQCPPPQVPVDIDGWFISFHTDQPVGPNDPFSHPLDLLGLYFAPAHAVNVVPTGVYGRDGHQIYNYFVALADCCLLYQAVDPRSDTVPAQDGVFREIEDLIYWLDIQAVVGHTWEPPDCQGFETENFALGPFWGWHTSPLHWNDVSTFSMLFMVPPNVWTYGPWLTVDGTIFGLQQVDQAFVLMTPDPSQFCPADITGPIPYHPDGNVDALDFLLLIAQWGTSGPHADITGPGGVPDGTVDALDFLLMIAQWGSPANC